MVLCQLGANEALCSVFQVSVYVLWLRIASGKCAPQQQQQQQAKATELWT